VGTGRSRWEHVPVQRPHKIGMSMKRKNYFGISSSFRFYHFRPLIEEELKKSVLVFLAPFILVLPVTP
jgi:hypothetical protein